MHELSIVMGIIDIADKAAKNANANSVDSIELEIGTLSGIEMQALDFAWEVATENTVLEGAERMINRIQAVAKCIECQYEFETKAIFEPCPKCGEPLTDLIKGKELRVKAVTVS